MAKVTQPQDALSARTVYRIEKKIHKIQTLLDELMSTLALAEKR